MVPMRCKRLCTWTAALSVLFASSAQPQTVVQVTSAFSPVEDISNPPVVVQWETAINEATDSIRITLYSFTSQRVKNALIDAVERGVDVRAILDSGLDHNCLAYELYDHGAVFKKYLPNFSGNILHHKYLLVDANLVVTGSANFTTAGQQYNHENQSAFRYVSGPHDFFDAYAANFEAMWNDEFQYNGRFKDWSPEAGYCGR